MTERVALIIENRIEVSREDLISKSQYFAALFSRNFKDSQSSEHRINYDIPIDALQTFVAWVSDHKAVTVGNGHRVKPSLAKYVSDLANFDGLMELLRLSVLYVADDLVEDLTNLIACHWLTPKKSVEIWLLAKELGLAKLRDLAKATCVSRLEYVPESSLLELTGEDFIELVGNIRGPDTMAKLARLLLGENCVEVSREDLISKSEYFGVLFSPNFSDYRNSEHRINYDIQIDTLQSFVDWVSDHVASVIGDRRHVKPSLAKYVGDSADFEGLLQLLQFSVLFVSETLIDDLTDLIACHWLVPQKCVQIWLLARDLVLVTLKDLAKATCVDRLQDIPESSLLELPGEDFIELVGNVHVKVCEIVPFNLMQQWVKHNVPPGGSNAFESRYPFTLLRGDASLHSLTNLYEGQYWKHNIQCIVVHKRTRNNDVKKCIYAWDGTTFSEIIELPRSLTFSTNDILGMRVVSRGFDIYLVGGEYGEGSRNYLKEIWRYSMISKTWYYVTSLQTPQRYAAIVFLNENLFLISNWDSMLRRGSRVDVVNVHTGEWKDVQYILSPIDDMSLICTEHNSLICTEHNSIFVYQCGAAYSYFKDDNSWVRRSSSNFLGSELDENDDVTGDLRVIDPRLLMTSGNYIYVLGWYEDQEEMEANGSSGYKIFLVENFEDLISFHIGDCTTCFFDQVANGPYVFGFSHKDDILCIEEIRISRKRVVESKIVFKEKRSDIENLCPYDSINCFNVYNPKSLNQLFVLEENAI